MLERASELLTEKGTGAFWLQPWTGIPIKIFGVLGAGRRLEPWQVLPISVAARAVRLGWTGGLAAVLGWRVRSSVRDRSLFLAVAYLVLAGYGWWATQLRRQATETTRAQNWSQEL
jgi:hypothetical protein